ncbi:MAG: metallophosphoesterase [Chloroflexia bacterium]|nr:metallophosphoesterase [Chloroflexia bacterium]
MKDRSAPRRFALPLLQATIMILSLPTLTLPGVSAQTATPRASPVSGVSVGPLPPAWLEFGPGGTLIARVIVNGACPEIVLDDLSVTMSASATPTEAFPVIACEATIPFGVEVATVAGQTLPLPSARLRRIAVIGDTGCRLNDWEKKYQACNDPQQWPFAQIAASVAAWDPDLIVHVGDYLYRESPCPAEGIDCAGSPSGDNWATWNADFFTPAAQLLGVAPWVFMRGNHETCERNPAGWFAFLDTRQFQAICQQFTEPYVARMNGLTLAVLDSAEAGDTKVTPEEQSQYKRQFEQLAQTAPPGSWLVTHRPVWGILEAAKGEFEVENASYQAATGGSLAGDYALVLSGHIHAAESIAFEQSSRRPPQVISGNAGTALDGLPVASPTAGELGDATVSEAETLSAFGFLTFELEPEGENWIVTQRDASGAPQLDCLLAQSELDCAPSQASG